MIGKLNRANETHCRLTYRQRSLEDRFAVFTPAPELFVLQPRIDNCIWHITLPAHPHSHAATAIAIAIAIVIVIVIATHSLVLAPPPANLRTPLPHPPRPRRPLHAVCSLAHQHGAVRHHRAINLRRGRAYGRKLCKCPARLSARAAALAWAVRAGQIQGPGGGCRRWRRGRRRV